MTNRIQMLSIAAIAAAITILASSTITTPALATSSKHEFRHDVRQFFHCVKDNDHFKISKHDFADCLTDNFNIHISKHTIKHL
jgi:hypothetical protein